MEEVGGLQSVRFARTDVALPKLVDQKNIHQFFEALQTLIDVAQAVSCQPKFWTKQDMDQTPAGHAISALTDDLYDLYDEIVTLAKQTPASAEDERQFKALTLIGYEVSAEARIREIVAVAAPLLTDTHGNF